jgi:hypothetical protein
VSSEPTAAEWMEISGRSFSDADRAYLEWKFQHQETLPVSDLVPLPFECGGSA